MRTRRPWILPIAVLLLASMTGCPNEAPVTKTPHVDESASPGCRVETQDGLGKWEDEE